MFKPVYASCPVCVITVGGGLLIAKKLGIDDLLVSIWLSGLNSAMAFLIFKKHPYLWSLIFYGLTIVYLTYTRQLNYPKVFLGMTIGPLTFFLAIFIDKLIKKIRKGKVLFPYQKVTIPLLLLILVTLIFKKLL